MRCRVWKLLGRGLFASLSIQTGWVVCAGPGGAASQALVRKVIPAAPGFEAEETSGSARRFFWRNGKVAAEVGIEGAILFRFPEGRELGISFPGAKQGVKPRGESVSYPVSYYVGRSKSWRTGIRWESVRYHEIYPGIDLVLVTHAGELEYNFEIAPRADPGKIRIRYHGAAVRLSREGDLVLQLGSGRMRQRRAIAFQGSRIVPCSYDLRLNEVTLRLGRYDLRHSLTIDPALTFSTYLGGASFDTISAMAADSAGNIYVTGETDSGSIPGGSEPTRSSFDAWVAKLNSAGSQLLYLVFLGGSQNDSGTGIAVDASGNAYVTGITASMDFPTTSGSFSTQFTGPQEAFISKLSPIGEIEYSTYLGGGADAGFAIAADATGAVYVAGQTASVSFPVTAGTIQRSNNGGLSDCFVSKLDAAGSSLVYSTYLGGSGLDLCTGIAIDGSQDVYVTGTTYSTNFPTAAALQSTLPGSACAFVAEIDPTGTELVYSTYLGGSNVDNGNAIAVDSTGSAYVAGATSSADFPTTAGAFQTSLGGKYNAFVSKLAPGGASLSYSTFLGGSSSDSAAAIAVDNSLEALVGGFTNSPNFPLASPIQDTFQGIFDAFAAVVTANGSSLMFSSYFGGSGDDRGLALAVVPGGTLALGGMTASGNFPTAAALQGSFGGDYDGFALNVQYEIGLAFYPLTPCRIADTREGSSFTGAFGAPSLSGGVVRSFPIPSSACSVPARAQAYSVNFGALPQGPLDYLTTWPAGLPQPNVGTLGSESGNPVSNAAIVPAGANGAISVFASDNTDLIIDINGYFAPPSSAQPLAFYPIAPCRIADTRTGSGFGGAFGGPSLQANVTRTLPMSTSVCSLPETAQAYSLNFGALPHAPLEFLTIWPAGQPLPLVGTLGSPSGNPVSNAALVPAGTGAAININASAATDIIVDGDGYFAAPGSAGALLFYPLAPCRIADTRTMGSGLTGAFGPPTMSGGSTREFPVPMSSCGVPPTAQAYSLNIGAVTPGQLEYLTVWPAGQTMPTVATLGAPAAGIVSDAAIVPAGTNGGINVFVSNTTDVIIDIDGYFAP